MNYPGELIVRSASATLPADARSAHVARTVVTGCLSPSVTAGVVADSVLCTSELVTNAIQHAGTPVNLRVELYRDHIRIEVSDDSDTWPARRPLDPLAESGRGLLITDRLSRAWGVVPRDHGKTVWFEVTYEGDTV